MFQNVIFDLDGTLLNTIDDLADAANWVCARHGWPLHTVEEYKRFVGNGIPRLVERFAPAPERTPEGLARALEEFSERYGAHRADKTAPYAGMPEAVERLRAAGEILAAAHSSWAEQPRAAMYSFSWSQKRMAVSSRMISLIIHQAGEKEKTGGGNIFHRGYCRGGKRRSEREEKQV